MNASQPKVFVGLFGLNRSLNWTSQSIARNILAPLKQAGIQPTVAAHFNKPKVIDNIHSGEKLIPHRSEGWWRLPLQALLIDDQDMARLPTEIAAWVAPSFPNDDIVRRQTRRNLIFQLYSLQRLWGLCDLMGCRDSDIFLFVRPDLEYLDPIDVATLRHQILVEGVDLITPEWGTFGGLNDRFAFCSRRGAALYASRLPQVDSFCRTYGWLQAESLLKVEAEREGLSLATTPLRALRVRANGATVRERSEIKLRPFEMVRAVSRKRLARLSLPRF